MGKRENIFDMVDEDRKAQAIAEAEEAYARGDFVENDIVMAWLQSMLDAIEAGRPLPPPPLSQER